jgi:hypothetical protein
MIIETKIYSCYPGQLVGKDVLYEWCEKTFGPMHDSDDHTAWTLTSHYDERPIPLNPFLFQTDNPKFYNWFALRWL